MEPSLARPTKFEIIKIQNVIHVFSVLNKYLSNHQSQLLTSHFQFPHAFLCLNDSDNSLFMELQEVDSI